jgi:hypothetical protein
VKPKNETFARHLLATRKQGAGEDIDQFYRALLILSKDCEFKSVRAEEHCSGFVCDSFIFGLTSTYIRQRLLESNSISLADALQQAKSLETAQTHATSYMINSPPDSQTCAAAEPKHSTALPAAAASPQRLVSVPSKSTRRCRNSPHEDVMAPRTMVQ